MASDMGSGGNKAGALGSGQQSSNKWMGISDEVANGTSGSRKSTSAAKYGGERKDGRDLQHRSSPGDNNNAGNGEGNSSNEKILKSFGPAVGTVASRQEMTIGGGQDEGRLVGKGAGATKDSGPSQYGGLKVQAGIDIVKGTSDMDKNSAKALKGIGKGKGKSAND